MTEAYATQTEVGTSRSNSGLGAMFRSCIRSNLQNPNNYVRALKTAELLFSRTRGYGANWLLPRLEALEKFAFWKIDEWSNDPVVEGARVGFLRSLRAELGPNLKTIADPYLRRSCNQLLAKIEFPLRVPDPFCRPSRGRIEFTDACNLKCSMCPHSFWEWERSFVKEWVIRRAETLYPWLTQLDLTGLGETLLAPNFKEALPRVPEHIRTSMISNGILLDGAVAEFLLANRLGDLSISIDSASPEVYRECRSSDKFEKVIENCRGLATLKRNLSSDLPFLSFNYTLCQKNLDDFVPLVRLASEIGFQRVHANTLMVFLPEGRENSVYWIQDKVRRTMEEAERVARELGIELFHPWPLDDAPPPPDHSEGTCKELWDFMYFRANGHMAPCCWVVEDYPTPPEVGWEEVWDGPAFRRLRTQVNLPGKAAPPLCRSCTLGHRIGPLDERYHFMEDIVEEHQAANRVLDPLLDRQIA